MTFLSAFVLLLSGVRFTDMMSSCAANKALNNNVISHQQQNPYMILFRKLNDSLSILYKKHQILPHVTDCTVAIILTIKYDIYTNNTIMGKILCLHDPAPMAGKCQFFVFVFFTANLHYFPVWAAL